MATVTHHIERRGMMSSGQREFHVSRAVLSCGHFAPGSVDHFMAAHPAHAGAIPPISAEMDCEACTQEAASRAVVARADADGSLSHTRASRFGSGVDAYVYDETYPRGVRHLASLPDSPETHAFLRTLARGMSPLSPTEPR